jgi:hypothetical protein
VEKDDVYVLNHTTRFLTRDNTDERHNFGQFDAGDPRGRVCEAWRFPVIDGHYSDSDPAESTQWNEVTFVYKDALKDAAVTGTFARAYSPVPMRRVADTPYLTVTVLVPMGEVHTYTFLVDGQSVIDPVNPQFVTLDNGRRWSRFFTQGCTSRLTLYAWEAAILERLTDHILPFRTAEGQRFLASYYESLDKRQREERYPGAYRFDESVGVVNFIDKILSREERHRLIDYRVCLRIVNQLLRQRNPFVEPREIPREMYVDLYEQMASGNVPGWDYNAYGNPRFFLQLLRRHTLTGAFAHPKHCGNSGASGWAYLSERYKDAETGVTLFDWRQALERPLGTNEHYRG